MGTDRSRSRTVIVVGGGVAGLSSCFHLVDKGIEKVVLIEKGRIGDGSSRRAGGRFEVLRGRLLEERFPDLKVGDEEYGVLDLRGGWNEPDRYIPALTAKVREMGVEIREGETVEEFLVESGQVKGVRLRNTGELRADAVVCTVNAWANSLLESVGQTLPVRSFVHERFVTMPFDKRPELPAINDDARKIYYRPTEDNRLLLGSTGVDPEQIQPGPDFDMMGLEPTPTSLPQILEAVQQRLPMMQQTRIDYHRVGLVSYAIDFQPNVGPVAALPGLYLATNFHSGGFGHHPAAGLFLAEFIVDGQTRIDLAAFSPDRFADFDTQAYLHRDISHHEMEEYWAIQSQRPVSKHH